MQLGWPVLAIVVVSVTLTILVGGLAGTNEWTWGEDAYLWSPATGTRNLGNFSFPCEVIAPWDCAWIPEVVFPAGLDIPERWQEDPVGFYSEFGVQRVQPGEEAVVQLLLENTTAVWPGDRYVIRSYSPVATIGGGMVLGNVSPRKRKRLLEHDREYNRMVQDVLQNVTRVEFNFLHPDYAALIVPWSVGADNVSITWEGGPVATESTTMGTLKAMYR